jgi:hypothetical protein
MAIINGRQPGLAGTPQYHLRHVISWEQIKQDVGDLGGGASSLAVVANHIHTNWPASSNLADPGLPNVDDPRAVETYTKEWARARFDDPRNYFYGDYRQNIRLGARYDSPTKAKAPGNRLEGSAFDDAARRRVVAEQLTAIGINGAYDPTSAVQPAQLELWLTNHSTLQQREIDQVTAKTTYARVMNHLVKQGVFNKLRLPAVFNKDDTQYGY